MVIDLLDSPEEQVLPLTLCPIVSLLRLTLSAPGCSDIYPRVEHPRHVHANVCASQEIHWAVM